MTKINYNKAEEILKGNVILKFSSPWCIPCRDLQEKLDEHIIPNLKTEINFFEVDISDKEGLKIARQTNTLGTPTLLFIKNGVEVKRMVGVKSLTDLKEAFENF